MDYIRQIVDELKAGEEALPQWIDHDSGWAGDSGFEFLALEDESRADTC
jgi:hypothetical protein